MADEQRQLVHLLVLGDKSALKELLSDQRSSDIAEVVELVDNEHRRAIFDAMDKPTAAINSIGKLSATWGSIKDAR